MLTNPVVICGASRQPLEMFLVTIYSAERGRCFTDLLWAKCIHGHYLKHASLLDYKPEFDNNRCWKKLCRVKDQLREILTLNKPYRVNDGYR